MDELLQELGDEYSHLMEAYHAKGDDELLDELNVLSARIAHVALMNKVVAGSTMAAIEASKMQKLKHKIVPKLDKEEIELVQMHEDVFGRPYEYNSTPEIIEGVMKGKINVDQARKLVDLKCLVMTEELNDRLIRLEKDLNS